MPVLYRLNRSVCICLLHSDYIEHTRIREFFRSGYLEFTFAKTDDLDMCATVFLVTAQSKILVLPIQFLSIMHSHKKPAVQN